MAVLQSPDLLGYCNIDKDELKELAEKQESDYFVNLRKDFKNASQKLLAIFKLIFKGDEMASDFLLYNILSKVYQRSPEGMAMGHLNLNISGLDAK